MPEPIGLVDIAQQNAELRDDINAALQGVLDSGAFVLGQYAAQFEEDFGKAFRIDHVIGCNSGTDALLLSLDAVRLERGPGEVITTPFTFFATVESIIQAGHRVRFVDVSADTFNLDPAATKAAIHADTVAIMPVHLFGQCADMDALRHGDLFLLEDAAQAVGATYKGKHAGALGDAAGFSFYPTKNLGAMGDAGAVTTMNAEFAAMMRSLRAHGEVKGEGSRTYHYERLGRNSRLDGFQAAVLAVKLKRWAAWQDARNNNATYYDEALAMIDGVTPPPPSPHGRHVYHQYAVRAQRRDKLKAHLAERGIFTNVFYPQTLHTQPALADMGLTAEDFPVAEQATREVLSIPVHAHVSAADRERIVAEIRAFYGA